jgi:hypothetical protein
MPRPDDRRRWDEDDEDDRPRRRRREDDDEDEDDRPRRRAKSGGSNGMAVTALVLGILSLFCSFLTGLPAIVFGFLGLARASKTGSGKGMAITGMVLGLVGTILTGVAGYFIYVGVKKGVTTIQEKFEEGMGNAQASNNLKRVSLAQIEYHDKNVQFPRSYHVEGFPATLPPESSRLSWRVSLLPMLNQQLLYSRFKPNEAWNSPANRPASDTYVSDYGDAIGSTQTRYRVFVGGGALFDADPPARKDVPIAQQMAQPVRMNGVTDGLSNTFFCVEAAETVPWAQHKEIPFNPNGPLPSFGRVGTDTFVVAMCDGSVRIVKKNTDPKVLKALITRAGGETVPFDW